MNNMRITDYVDGLFKDTAQTEKVTEQKEELQANLTERVRDYIDGGMSFDGAFEAVKNDIGNIGELIAEFEPEYGTIASQKPPETESVYRGYTVRDGDEGKTASANRWKPTAVAPFIYLALGFAFGAWSWAWVIIPVTAILSSPIDLRKKIVSISPFVFVMGGMFFGWWAWGWIIIPMSAVLLVSKVR